LTCCGSGKSDDALKEQFNMAFDRWVSPWSRTWAHVIFKKHHTQLNDLWWSHHCASRRAANLARSVGEHESAIKAFPAASIDRGRANMSLQQWYGYYCEFDNWNRLSNALALCSYFEIFLVKVVSQALRSDPACLLNSPRAVDGVALLKRNELPDIKPQLLSITKNDWSGRVAAYRRFFSYVPPQLEDNIGELDHLRKLRNAVGHSFGRELEDYDSPLVFKAAELQRLSDTRLIKWLGIVENACNAIDDHLRKTHIGSFEIFDAYHSWDKKFHMGHQSEEGAFKHLFPPRTGLAGNVKYFREAIAHYRRS
jgi:hypothetical protein